jgi:hypothetical protein
MEVGKRFFFEKKKQKTFPTGSGEERDRAHHPSPNPFKSKVFCFFFSKKNRLLPHRLP